MSRFLSMPMSPQQSCYESNHSSFLQEKTVQTVDAYERNWRVEDNDKSSFLERLFCFITRFMCCCQSFPSKNYKAASALILHAYKKNSLPSLPSNHATPPCQQHRKEIRNSTLRTFLLDQCLRAGFPPVLGRVYQFKLPRDYNQSVSRLAVLTELKTIKNRYALTSGASRLARHARYRPNSVRNLILGLASLISISLVCHHPKPILETVSGPCRANPPRYKAARAATRFVMMRAGESDTMMKKVWEAVHSTKTCLKEQPGSIFIPSENLTFASPFSGSCQRDKASPGRVLSLIPKDEPCISGTSPWTPGGVDIFFLNKNNNQVSIDMKQKKTLTPSKTNLQKNKTRKLRAFTVPEGLVSGVVIPSTKPFPLKDLSLASGLTVRAEIHYYVSHYATKQVFYSQWWCSECLSGGLGSSVKVFSPVLGGKSRLNIGLFILRLSQGASLIAFWLGSMLCLIWMTQGFLQGSYFLKQLEQYKRAQDLLRSLQKGSKKKIDSVDDDESDSSRKNTIQICRFNRTIQEIEGLLYCRRPKKEGLLTLKEKLHFTQGETWGIIRNSKFFFFSFFIHFFFFFNCFFFHFFFSCVFFPVFFDDLPEWAEEDKRSFTKKGNENISEYIKEEAQEVCVGLRLLIQKC
ncbi:hypothetical protein VP01_3086g3 [Puccinia sorghi]|uniref:Uncharacterized protein n=1 Tax=Puccinia sorghi TaxID=27349 RepID=A0A0L6UZL8_9BASI|nr:hypothetical protein VP01_3086g3 [Puccinia sorghi]